jgi:IstB-like ATP binding protein
LADAVISANLPLAKDIDDFQFDGTPIHRALINDLAGGSFMAQLRNVVPVGGTGPGKTHVAIAMGTVGFGPGAITAPLDVAITVEVGRSYRLLKSR